MSEIIIIIILLSNGMNILICSHTSIIVQFFEPDKITTAAKRVRSNP